MKLRSDLKWTECQPDKALLFESAHMHATLNPLRGLSIESVGRPKVRPFAGRIPHGTFSRMDLSADWYTGNVVLQIPGRHQQTDLKKVTAYTSEDDKHTFFTTTFAFAGGTITKTYCFSKNEASWTQEYLFNIPELPVGSLRFGFLTLCDLALKKQDWRLRTHCGGLEAQEFQGVDVDFDHGSEVTSLVAAHQALGMTENTLDLVAAQQTLTVQLQESTFRPLPMVENKMAKEGRLLRLYFSGSEYDETRRGPWKLENELVRFKYTLKG